MRLRSLLIFVCLANALPASGQTVLTSGFDASEEGWTTNPADEPGSLTHLDDGGNPGGFIRIDDTLGANVFSFLEAPDEFTGDLRVLDGGELTFDAILLEATSDFPLEEFGNVIISSSSDSASRDLAPNPLQTRWTTFSAPLTAAAWGKSQSAWLALLADVVSVRIDLEPIGGPNEVVGVDNVTLASPGFESNCSRRLLEDVLYECDFEADDTTSGTFSFTLRGTDEGFDSSNFSGGIRFDDDLFCECVPRGSLREPRFFESNRFICLNTGRGAVAFTGAGRHGGTRISGYGRHSDFGTFLYRCRAQRP